MENENPKTDNQQQDTQDEKKDNNDAKIEKKEEENSQQSNVMKTINVGGREIPIDEAESLLNDTIGSSTSLGTESLFNNIEQEQYYETLRRLDISVDDLALLKELKSGNKDAVLFLLKQSGIKLDDIDEESLKNINIELDKNILIPRDEIEINRIYKAVGEDKFSKILNTFDEKSKEILFGKDKELVIEIANDIDIGLFDRAIKEVKLDKKLRRVPRYVPDIELYFQKVTDIVKEQQSKKENKKKNETKNDKVKEQVKSPVGSGSSSKKGGSSKKTISNYMKIKDDKEFLELFNKEVGDI